MRYGLSFIRDNKSNEE